jgi:hypothetical protein
MAMRTRLQPATAVIVTILVLACQSAAPTANPSGSAPPTQFGASPAPTGNVSPTGTAPTAAPVDLPPTSEELIGVALESGSITYELSLLYRALALYNSPALPEAFRSTVTDMGAATELLVEIDAHEAELSGAILAQLAPYRVRPSDPTSIFSTLATAPIAALAGHPLTTSATAWIHEPAAGGAARVWVEDSPGAKRRLDQHAQDVTRVWYAMQDVFTYPDPDQANLPSASVNPDAAVDFYWVEASDIDPRRAECSDPSIDHCVFSSYSAAGFARAAEPRRVNASSAYFVMDAGRGGDAALFELAHELAHGGEFHYDNGESTWLAEATANWAAYRVFQKLGLPPEPAYGWLPKLFDRLDMPITTAADFGGYRAWLYFQFAAMEEGDGIVARIWEAAGRQGEQGETAIDAVFPFDKHFADFALRNWNQEPVPRRYRDAPDQTFPPLKPSMQVYEEPLRAGEKASLEAALPQLASAYYSYTIDPAVRKITFDNALMGKAGAHVWAIVSIGQAGSGSDFVEDWGGVSKRVFCLPRENVTKIVLVVSNSQIARGSNLSGEIAIDPLAEGCGAGGLVTYNRTIVKSVVTEMQCGSRTTADETQTVTISVAFDGDNKGTATVNDQLTSVDVSTFIDCSTGKTSTVTATRSAHIVGTKDAIAFWLINSGVLDFHAFWEMVTGGTSLYELRCEPVSCDENVVEDVASLYGAVAFMADVDPDAAVISGSKVEDASKEGVSDVTTYTWTIER